MAEIYGWKLTIHDYEHDEDEDNPVMKFYIMRSNAVNGGILLLKKILQNNGWEDEWILTAEKEYWKLMNSTINQNIMTKNHPASYFEQNSIHIELISIPYEDELK